MRCEDREGAEYVASAAECTGLVPALKEGGDEEERALYAVRPAKRRRGEKK